ELAGSLAQPLRLGSGSLDLRLPVAELLLRERDAPLARAQLFLGLLDQAAPHVEGGADLLVAARASVDLGRSPRERLVQQSLAVGERRPGLLELVALLGHHPE